MCTGTQRPRPTDGPPIEDASPSVKLVYKTLEYEGPLTQKALVEQTDLARPTVASALSELEEDGVVREEFYAPDARQRLYVLETDD